VEKLRSDTKRIENQYKLNLLRKTYLKTWKIRYQ
jgi:hypothetical protein